MRRLLATFVLVGLTAALNAQTISLPMKDGSVKFAVIGDTGTGDKNQMAVAKALADARRRFPYNFALMAGDNMYGGDSAKDYVKKFESPYKPLLDGGVKFYAALGNHDDPNQRFYKPFNMNGERYYTFKAPNSSVRFFALDSNYMDDKQLQWLEKELAASGSDWKIAYFHHPLYSSGSTHGSADVLRQQIEPLFVKYGVTVVFTGHEHFYERIKPQKGITYFIGGSSAKLRAGDIIKTDLTAKGFDTGYTYTLVEIIGDDLMFQVLTPQGQTVDSGTIHKIDVKAPGGGTRPVTTTATKAAQAAPVGQTPVPAQPSAPARR
jgi:hypothetical protein